MWKRGEIAPKEQFLLFSTIFCYLFLDFHVKIGTRISLRYKRLFEISEVEITRVDYIVFSETVDQVEKAKLSFKEFITHEYEPRVFRPIMLPGKALFPSWLCLFFLVKPISYSVHTCPKYTRNSSHVAL